MHLQCVHQRLHARHVHTWDLRYRCSTTCKAVPFDGGKALLPNRLVARYWPQKLSLLVTIAELQPFVDCIAAQLTLIDGRDAAAS